MLKAFAKHNDEECIKAIFRTGYPWHRDADEIWTGVSLSGDCPNGITTPLGRAVRHALWEHFCEDHESCINEVIDVMKYLHGTGNLSINEQKEEHNMTALHLLFKEALPQFSHMQCARKLLVTMIELGADVNIIDNYGKTAYDYAAAKKAPKSVLKLLQSKQ